MCSSCGSATDADDNFCRHCGFDLTSARLPAVRTPSSTTIWQPSVSPVVKGAAVMAAGTVGQFLFRRVVSNLLGSASGPRRGGALRTRRRADDGMVDESQIITETVMLRRVRVRRQA
jgi:hypothetical protein